MQEKETIVVLGTAPENYVRKLLEKISEKNASIHLVVPPHKAPFYEDSEVRMVLFKGMLNWHRVRLLLKLWRIKPDTVVLVHGDVWFHENVIEMLSFFRVLYPGFEFMVSVQGDTPDYHPLTNPPTKKSLMFLAVITCLVFYANWVYGFWKEFTGLMLFAESLLIINRQKIAYDLKMQPGMKMEWSGTGKLHTVPHTRYGWINEPCLMGRYQNKVLGFVPSEYEWHYAHDADGLRVTGKLQDTAKPVISVLGCSITYGQSVNNEETYCWKLQERMGNFRIKNFGVGAYSLYQMYLRLTDTIENDKPDAVVIGFHQELEQRNTNAFKYRMFWMRTFKNPSCLSNGKKLKQYKSVGYSSVPFSAQLNCLQLIEYCVNRLKFFGRSRKKKMRMTSEHLLFMIRALCDKNGAKLMISCIDNSENYYDFFMKNGFSWCITDVTSRDLQKWTMYPFDGHPNAKAHQLYADVIGKNLKRVLEGKHVVPDAGNLGQVITSSEPIDGFIYQHY